ATRHMQRQVFMCMPVGVAVPILIASFVPGGGLMVNFLPFGMGFILWAAGVTMALTTGLNRVRPFQRKFAELQTR
ncbi:MAG: hypothetical protein KC620_20595, partial [Myxococcales bacterium]|nr:hypothetical protein [Myxococcales bacterium]